MNNEHENTTNNNKKVKIKKKTCVKPHAFNNKVQI